MFRFPQAFCLAAGVRDALCMPSLPTLPYLLALLTVASPVRSLARCRCPYLLQDGGAAAVVHQAAVGQRAAQRLFEGVQQSPGRAAPLAADLGCLVSGQERAGRQREQPARQPGTGEPVGRRPRHACRQSAQARVSRQTPAGPAPLHDQPSPQTNWSVKTGYLAIVKQKEISKKISLVVG